MKITPTLLLALSCSVPAPCQLLQSHPELCGKQGSSVSLPAGISAASHGVATTLSFGTGLPNLQIPGPGEIDEVCPLADGRLIVFGRMMTGSSFSIVDPTKPLLLETVWGYDPRLSPDQKWIVFRKFFPRMTDLPASDEYLRYDLSRSPAQNRAPGTSIDEREEVGTAIYPVGWRNELADNIGAPDQQQHSHLSSFFWALDSSAVLFADENQGKRSVVLITMGEHGETAAFFSPFAASLECAKATAKDANGQPTGIRGVEFGPQEGADRVMFIGFEAEGCSPKTVLLHSDSFQPAPTEARASETSRRETKAK